MLLTGLLCGILLGFVMQRGRFCITGAFRDLYVTKNNKMFIALLLAITVQSIGFFGLKEIGVLNVEPAENFAFLAVILGHLYLVSVLYWPEVVPPEPGIAQQKD